MVKCMSKYKKLLNKIKNKEAIVGVIGLGYVGLPLTLSILEKGYKTYGFDIDKNKIKLLKKGISYITGLNLDSIGSYIKDNKFIPTCNFSKLSNLDIILICVPTPLNKRNKPDMSYVNASIKNIIKYSKNNSLIIIESTVYPEATIDIKKKYFKNKFVFLAFSPERIDPANENYNVNNTIKIVGGIDKISSSLTKEFYKNIINARILEVSNSTSAEMCKILENTYRLVNIALILEFAKACNNLNINIWEVIYAANTKPYGFQAFYPGPGVGGHCIPIDPLYFLWKMKKNGIKLPLIKKASQIVENTPKNITKTIMKIIKEKNIKKAKVLLIGITYKKNVNDLRESPSLEIYKLLFKKNIKVSFFDSYVKKVQIKKHLFISEKLNNIKNYDLVVICVDHSNLDYDYIYKESKLLLDLKNTKEGVKNDK